MSDSRSNGGDIAIQSLNFIVKNRKHQNATSQRGVQDFLWLRPGLQIRAQNFGVRENETLDVAQGSTDDGTLRTNGRYDHL